jgi:hypothetical protein
MSSDRLAVDVQLMRNAPVGPHGPPIECYHVIRRRLVFYRRARLSNRKHDVEIACGRPADAQLGIHSLDRQRARLVEIKVLRFFTYWIGNKSRYTGSDKYTRPIDT